MIVAVPDAAIEAMVQLAVVVAVVHVAPDALTTLPPLTLSDSGTEVAASGPLLAAVIVNVPFWPPFTDAGGVTDGAMSEAGLTVTLAVAALFVVSASNAVELPDAVLDSVPGAVAFKVSVMVSVAPTASEAIEQLTGSEVQLAPAVAATETKLAPVKLSVSVTFDATEGPRFFTVIVKTAFWPLRTEAGPLFVTAMSQEGLIVAVADALSFVEFGSPLYVEFALIVSGEPVPACATSVIVVVPVAAIEAIVQVAVVAVVVHVAPVALTTLPPLTLRATGADVAASGPALLIVTVNVAF